MRWKRIFTNRWIKLPVFVLCLIPALLLAWRGFNGGLGANPIEFITHATGDWTLRFLAITLAVTPLRKLLRWPELVRFRRMFGLFAFFYGCLHFLTYVWLDKFFDLAEITKDIVKRPFITVGFTAFILLVPLATTSTAGWIRRLGGKRWQKLHRLRVRERGRGCSALLLVGEIRHHLAGFLRSDRHTFTRLSGGD